MAVHVVARRHAVKHGRADGAHCETSLFCTWPSIWGPCETSLLFFFFNLLGGTSAFIYAGSSLFFFFGSYVGVLRHSAMPVRPSFFLLYYTLTGCEGYAVHPH